MKLTIQTPRDFINPLLSKRSVIQSDIEKFKIQLKELLHVNIAESEEHQKNAVRDFLVHSFGYTINTKGKIDWAIFQNGQVEVLIEAKRLDNVSEMITPSELNRKALHEAILYFMQERDEGNHNLKHIIILTAFKWFIFDAKEFDRLFWQNKSIKKIYTDFKNPSLLGDKTKDFYSAIAKNLTDEIEITGVYFDLSKEPNNKELIAIYKLLSPDSLLKAFNPNDANTLNREFYSELLYILGLEEVKEGGKKLIGRAQNPQLGSLYENIAGKLTQYGKPNDFESILKLMIIWINRILFLKLLESQIVKWNANSSFRFLNATKIDDFDKLEMLFFEVLAKRPSERNHREFDYIPYLNSSLFELHEMEEKSLKISNLADDTHIAYYAKTVIKDEKSNKKTGQICTLHYLFEFLDAYDFSSEGSEEVVEDNKTLINASVLGLIFEKLNGYKDGSFYTPSFITMYMAKESLTKAIFEKFFTCKGWKCETLADLHNKIEDIHEANDIINSLTICDPAVGSGHFLVSALGEILSIKSALGILCDAEGKRLKGYRLELVNDELIVKDDEGEIFEYQKNSAEKSRVQKALFKEKQRIIENSLFGVDINPNSVNICRLRLWIELLKNSYYKEDGMLDTLPNIDINIKCGNSLISRFDLKDELKIKNIKYEIENYKKRVSDYKENLGTKKELLDSIASLKAKFKLSLKAEWKVQKTLEAKLKEYVGEFGYEGLSDMLSLTAIKNKYGQTKSLFGDEVDEKKRLKLFVEVQKQEAQIEEIEQGKIYENAFEWRFEFPEVLDEKGDFLGFDVVIGNPPYGVEFDQKTKEYLNSVYKSVEYQIDAYAIFMERASQILKKEGILNFIIPSTWLAQHYFKNTRKYMIERFAFDTLLMFRFSVFSEATVEASIFLGRLTMEQKKEVCYATLENEEAFVELKFQKIEQAIWEKNPENGFNLAFDASTTSLIQKIESHSRILEEVCEVVSGIVPYEVGKGVPKQSKEDVKNRIYDATCKIDERYRAYLVGTNIRRFGIEPNPAQWIQFGKNLAAPRGFDFAQQKIVVRQTSDKIIAAIDNAHFLNLKSIHNIVLKEPSDEKYKVLVAILNSHIMDFYYSYLVPEKGRVFAEVKGVNLRKLPIPNIELEAQKELVALVDKILTCKASNPKADTSELEAQIDKMVYKLYELNDDEIAIIEG